MAKPFFLFGLGEKAYDEDVSQIDEAKRKLAEYQSQVNAKLSQGQLTLDNQTRDARQDLRGQVRNAKLQNQNSAARAAIAGGTSMGGSDVYNAAMKAYASDEVNRGETESSRSIQDSYNAGRSSLSLARQSADSDIRTQTFAIDQATRQLPSQFDAILGGLTPIVQLGVGAGLMFVPGGQAAGIGMLASGAGSAIGGAAGQSVAALGAVGGAIAGNWDNITKGVTDAVNAVQGNKEVKGDDRSGSDFQQGLKDFDATNKAVRRWNSPGGQGGKSNLFNPFNLPTRNPPSRYFK